VVTIERKGSDNLAKSGATTVDQSHLGPPPSLTVKCGCQQSLRVEEVEELESDDVFVRFHCDACGWAVGAEGRLKEIEPLVPTIIWSDEAHYHLSRLPPYLASLVRDEVKIFAGDQQYRIVTYSRLVTARNKGQVKWSPDAERRLANVPSGIRTMARTELERTALDRDMPEVTVSLMEEVKTRYFGMATGRS